jgi:hypothetical protein
MILTAETDLDVFQVAVIRPVDATLFGRSYYGGGSPADDNTISVLFQPPAQAPEEAVRRR